MFLFNKYSTLLLGVDISIFKNAIKYSVPHGFTDITYFILRSWGVVFIANINMLLW